MAKGAFKVGKLFYGMGDARVGLAKEYVVDGRNTILIQEHDKEGRLRYPGLFEIAGEAIRLYPLKKFNGVPEQYFVPISALDKVNEQVELL